MAHDHFGDVVREKFFEFLETFSTANAAYSMSQASAGTAGEESQQYYIEQLKAMRESEKTTLFVDWQHLMSIDADLAEELELQYLRVDPFLRKASPACVNRLLCPPTRLPSLLTHLLLCAAGCKPACIRWEHGWLGNSVSASDAVLPLAANQIASVQAWSRLFK